MSRLQNHRPPRGSSEWIHGGPNRLHWECSVANTSKAISSCLQHQHWAGRHNSSWQCKIEICFMCLKLIFIFPDSSLPVPQTQILVCLSHPVVIILCHCRSHRLLPGTATTSSLSLSPSAPSQRWNFTLLLIVQPGPGFRIGTRVAVAANGSRAGWEPRAATGRNKTVVQRAGTSTQTRRKGGTESRKHGPNDVRGATCILEIHPESPRVS